MNGVTWYKKMKVKGPIYAGFPNGKVSCENCYFCRKDRSSGIERHVCMLTNDFVLLREIGANCPLEEVEENNEQS